VLGVYIGRVLVYIKGGGVLVGFVELIILIAILGARGGGKSDAHRSVKLC